MKELGTRLAEYAKSDIYRWHMPGHKGNSSKEYYEIDITEIDGFDNLHHPDGILKEAMDKASRFYGSRRTWYLINGSTCGILSAIAAVSEENTRIAIARNSHRAVYNAAYLNKLKLSYIYPQNVDKFGINGGICPSDVEKLLNCQTDIKAVYITSPTYEGIVSNIEGIAKVVHSYGIPLIVDEAHGAHFGMNDSLPKSALTLGADVVIQSLHKTMNALTQTALIHTSKNSLISDKDIDRYLSMYQTSSPSYVLMQSIDACINDIISNSEELFNPYINRLKKFYNIKSSLKHLSILDDGIIRRYGVHDRDMGKIVISTINTDKNGKWLYDIMRNEYNLQPEMASGDYVICMTSYMDTEVGFERLKTALLEIDKQLKLFEKKVDIMSLKSSIVCEDICNSMDSKRQERIRLSEANNRISGEFIYAYPPGIPFVVPGEMITNDIIYQIENYKKEGLNIQGLEDMECEYIYVLN